jgi:hypothetical protein
LSVSCYFSLVNTADSQSAQALSAKALEIFKAKLKPMTPNNNTTAFITNLENGLTHPSEVAKIILQAVMADNPDFRYVVGKDAVMLLEARKNMSEIEFQNLIKKRFNLQNI